MIMLRSSSSFYLGSYRILAGAMLNLSRSGGMPIILAGLSYPKMGGLLN